MIYAWIHRCYLVNTCKLWEKAKCVSQDSSLEYWTFNWKVISLSLSKKKKKGNKIPKGTSPSQWKERSEMGMGPWALQAAMEWAKELGLSGGRAKRPKKKSTFDLIPYHHLQKDPKKIKMREHSFHASMGVQWLQSIILTMGFNGTAVILPHHS